MLANKLRTGKFLRLLEVQTSITEGSGGFHVTLLLFCLRIAFMSMQIGRAVRIRLGVQEVGSCLKLDRRTR